ncbi:P-loop containing nucleoside triphosphate hydrolase protein [Scheffersomyces amazonensis]|uniref:P-loop containing nucleoside triphosphate hydrolase protein n=1 Tax=Scheffersomyces amazonensis TaxID=1078765 RepID=UPI00315C6442
MLLTLRSSALIPLRTFGRVPRLNVRLFSNTPMPSVKMHKHWMLSEENNKPASEVSITEEVRIEDPEVVETPDVEKYGIDELRKTGYFSETLLQALYKAQFRQFTPVQQKAMVPMLQEPNGLVVRAKTGTGKTLAFTIPALQEAINAKPTPTDDFVHKGKITTLVIVPTRDLAFQIEIEINKITKHLPVDEQHRTRVQVISPGAEMLMGNRFYSQKSIVVATPGKLIEFFRKNGSYLLDRMYDLRYRIYDEGDRLLDVSFKDQLDEIDVYLREARRDDSVPLKSVLFSATIDRTVDEFAKRQISPDYKFIDCVDKDDVDSHENIHQILVNCNDTRDGYHSAFSYILENLKRPGFKAILFLPTIAACDWFHEMLLNARGQRLYDEALVHGKYRSDFLILHGKKTQPYRTRVVKKFRKLSHGVLVCTDVAARGLDFNDVSDVIQTAASSEINNYVHKIGRTARAGKTGVAVAFIPRSQSKFIDALKHEKNIKFAEIIDSSDIEKVPNVFEKTRTDKMIEDKAFASFLAYGSQVGGVYRLNKNNIVTEVVDFYRLVAGSETAKMPLGNYMRKFMNLPRHLNDAYFDYYSSSGSNSDYGHSNSRYGHKEGGYRGNKEGGYGGNREGGYRGNREGGYRGNREGGNRGNSEGRYRVNREGGYKGNREGGYEGGYKGKDSGDGN